MGRWRVRQGRRNRRAEEVATLSTQSREGLPEEVILEQRPGGKAGRKGSWIENQGQSALRQGCCVWGIDRGQGVEEVEQRLRGRGQGDSWGRDFQNLKGYKPL